MTTTIHPGARPPEHDGARPPEHDDNASPEWRVVPDRPDGESAHTSSAAAQPRRAGWLDRLPLLGLLGATALLYLVGLSRSGWANQFYAAAAQAGAKSWKAFLFGSLDSSNFITVDKPPASLWVMDLSVKIFGVNSWAVLVPQALEGVAAVALLYAAVTRIGGRTAGLLAGAVLATTPVATLMFRFDNPDALLVLLMTAAAYATVRALDGARPRWLVLAGALIGLAFLTKMLQGLLVLPGFAGAYLVAAPTALRARVVHVLAAGAAMVVAAGWWIALVELWPAGSRPYIGGSTNNSILELVFGYNGIGRLTGADNNGSVGAATGGGFSSGQTGLFRMFGTEMGSQISWLLPAALVGIGALTWLTAGRPRTDLLRASTIVWGGWLVVTGLVLSFASGIIHAYYTVALAPAIAAVVALAVGELWRARSSDAVRWTLAALVTAAAWWTYVLLGRASWHPELRWLVLLSGAGAIGGVLLGGRLAGRRARIATVVTGATLVGTLLLAPAAYSLQTASTAHTGALPTAGPSTGGGFGGFGGRAGGRLGGGRTGSPNGGTGFPGGGIGGTTTGSTGRISGGFGGGRAGGFGGGLGGATTVSTALTTALRSDARTYQWAAATVSDNNAASLELASGAAVMSLGGYNGTDDAITLAAFKQLVRTGAVHYFVADARGFIGSTAANTSTAYAIEQWVTATYKAKTLGGTTVYDLTAAVA